MASSRSETIEIPIVNMHQLETLFVASCFSQLNLHTHGRKLRDRQQHTHTRASCSHSSTKSAAPLSSGHVHRLMMIGTIIPEEAGKARRVGRRRRRRRAPVRVRRHRLRPLLPTTSSSLPRSSVRPCSAHSTHHHHLDTTRHQSVSTVCKQLQIPPN